MPTLIDCHYQIGATLKQICFFITTLLCFSIAVCRNLRAQAVPTASTPAVFSTFGALNYTYTGLAGGKNLGATVGGDISIRPFHFFYPAIEVRGTYPVKSGNRVGIKDILAGIRVERYYNRVRPYADLLAGRAKMEYQDGGYPNPAASLLFVSSASNAYSMGGGLNYTITSHFALKVDAQILHLSVPVTGSHALYSKPISIGLVYRFSGPPPD